MARRVHSTSSMRVVSPSCLLILLASGCVLGAGEESSSGEMTPPFITEAGVVADEPPEPSATRVRNLLTEEVWILWGDETVLPGWDDGIAAGSGDAVPAGGVSADRAFDPQRSYFVLSTASGAELDGDGVRVQLVVEDGVTILEVAVESASAEAEAEVESSEPTAADGAGPTQLGPMHTGSANGNSTTTASWSQWWDLDGNDNSNLRYTMKSQAREAAWSNHKGTQEYTDRLAACRAAGGTDLFIATTDCGYWPGAGGTCYAKCTWTYRCLKLGG